MYMYSERIPSGSTHTNVLELLVCETSSPEPVQGQLVVLRRLPTLWRHSTKGLETMDGKNGLSIVIYDNMYIYIHTRDILISCLL